MKRLLVRYSVWLVLLLMLVLPVTTFFRNRGGVSVLTVGDWQTTASVIFPLFGLLAFTLITTQILIATNRWWLDAYWPAVLKYHRLEGVFALCFALLHPLAILLGFGLSNYLSRNFVASSLRVWLLPAYLALSILICTVVTAVLYWRWGRAKWWFKLHRLNYAVFGLIWLHSWFIGSDVRSSVLKWLWLGYLGLASASLVGRWFHHRRLAQQVLTHR